MKQYVALDCSLTQVSVWVMRSPVGQHNADAMAFQALYRHRLIPAGDQQLGRADRVGACEEDHGTGRMPATRCEIPPVDQGD
jgi:hypothetical protein